MLKSLYIKNYALIDSLEIDFTSGFSVITGETGAGKSIILGALGLILGQRADIKSLKQGENKCVIEGVFDVSAYNLKSFCEEREIEYDAKSYILRREILSSGKSRGFINDTPVTLNDLRDLGSRLIDIHSQHQNLLLADDTFQMQVIDILAGSRDMLTGYQVKYKEYKHSEKALKSEKEAILKSKEEEEYIRFQYKVLNDATLKDGEQEELESEQDILSHAEDIKSALYKCYTLLSDDDGGVVPNLKDSLLAARSLTQVYDRSVEIAQRLETSYIDMQDLSAELERLSNDIEYSPDRLTEVQERLNIIYSLQKRYNVDTVAGLIELSNKLEQQLSAIDSSDVHLDKLEKDVRQRFEEVQIMATALSDKRRKASKEIEKTLVDKISSLGMPNVRFECHFSDNNVLDNTGKDNLEFLFSANKNIPLQPVAEIASGGEISRLMLCLKSMIAGATALPSIIFDEIDTGVSGEIADKMGAIMQEFGQQMQVLAITHLPQIAARGKEHYKVYKSDDTDTTTTNLVRLTKEDRLREIAGMLSGAKLTEAALDNAREMLGY